MSYGNELVTILRPLGVYSFREGSFSLAELQALGAALDEADEALSRAQKETIVKSAGARGLSKWEAAVSKQAACQDDRGQTRGHCGLSPDQRRQLYARGRSTGACARAALRAAWKRPGRCNHVKVWFPGVMGIPEGFSQMKIIIEDILPCQLGITYWFRYCTWQETEDYGLSWGDLDAMTWHGWETYHED